MSTISKERKRTVHEVAFRLAFDMQTQMSGKVGDFGVDLTPLKMRILRVVWSADDVTAQDVVQILKRDKAQVARLVEDLTSQDLIRREVNPNDRRSKILRLTEGGEKIFRSVEAIESDFANELVKGINDSELKTFFNVADQISENLKAL